MNVPWPLRLLRPALAPTAAADVFAAAAVAGGAPALRLLPAVCASLCIYGAGMAQNDLVDRERDRRLHPGRLLVVDPGRACGALFLVAALYTAGLLLGLAAGAGIAAGSAVFLANAYNLAAKRIPGFDALVLGGARSANLSLGFAAAGIAVAGPARTYALGYGLFIAGVTVASRAEDSTGRRRTTTLWVSFLLLSGAAALLAAARGLIPADLLWFVLVGLAGIALLAALSRPTARAAERYVLRCLQLIFVLHAAVLITWGVRGGLLAIAACAAATAILLSLSSPGPATVPSSP